MKKFTAILTLSLMMLAMLCACAMADDSAEVTWSNPKAATAGVALDSVSSSIKKASSSSVTIKAETEANQTVDQVGGKAVIQQWNNNTWETYKTYNFYAYDASSNSLSRTVSVDSGYSYRLRVKHSAITESDSDSATTTTSSITVP